MYYMYYVFFFSTMNIRGGVLACVCVYVVVFFITVHFVRIEKFFLMPKETKKKNITVA